MGDRFATVEGEEGGAISVFVTGGGGVRTGIADIIGGTP